MSPAIANKTLAISLKSIREEAGSQYKILARFWANWGQWYKQQPLYVIESYFGTEIAFYFAWLGFYNKMLLPAAFLGTVCFLFGMATVKTDLNVRSTEICNSSIILCPTCYKWCRYIYLQSSCFYSNMEFVFDNTLTVIFAVVMSFWATIYVQLWKREQALLQIRWNVTRVERDTTTRTEYEERAIHIRISPITEEPELYIPKHVRCLKYTFTVSSCIFLVLLVVLALFCITLYRLTATYWLREAVSAREVLRSSRDVELFVSFSTSTITVIFILVFQTFYAKTAKWLTNLENPRTQLDWENSFIYKTYILAFVNNYAIMFYIAFFKGRFFSHPGNMSSTTHFSTDRCDPAGCVVDLSIQLMVFFLIKSLLFSIMEIILPKTKIRFKKLIHRGTHFTTDLPAWEQDYVLNVLGRHYLMYQYLERILQYGFVIFFVAAFPLGPLFALCNNLARVRIDAIKFLKTCRRPIPQKCSGLGAWNGILQAVTYIGVVTNAFVIAFTSDFVPREIYRYTQGFSLEGYINSTLSEYDATGLENPASQIVKTCYYSGKRYPPDHPSAYSLTSDYWLELAIKFMAVILFEHIVMAVNALLSYIIPDIPRAVKEELNFQQNQFKQLRMKALHETYMRQQQRRRRDPNESFTIQSKHLNIKIQCP